MNRTEKGQLYFTEQIKESANYFDNWLYPSYYENLNNNGLPLRRSIFHQKLENLSFGNDGYEHNSIPCNLKDGAMLINKFFKNNLGETNIRYFITLYSLLFYLQAEKCAVIYLQLGYHQKGKLDKFKWEEFPTLQKIKYWANFFKHPKSSIFLHHPTFHLESFQDNPNIGFKGKIDSAFVKKYFSGEKNNSKLEDLLLNQSFKVFFPDIPSFTKELCSEFEKLIDIINSEPKNIEILKKFRKKLI